MPACQAKGCSNRSGLVHNHRYGIYFYQFPSREKSPTRYDEWCRFVGKSKENVKEQRICSYHFKKTDFDESQMLRMKMLSELGERPKGPPLKNTAVPSILTKDMPGKCFVYTCANTKELFPFPHRFYCPERFQMWADFCNQNYAPGSKSKMCIDHFSEKYHKLTDRGLKVLTDNAVPTVTVTDITSKKDEYELPSLRTRSKKSITSTDQPVIPRKRGRLSKDEYQIGTVTSLDIKPECGDVKSECNRKEVEIEDLKPKPSKLSGVYIANIMKEMRMKRQLGKEKQLSNDIQNQNKEIKTKKRKEKTLSKQSRLENTLQSCPKIVEKSKQPETFKSTESSPGVMRTETTPLLEKQIENLLSGKLLNATEKRKCEYFNEITKKPKSELTEFDIQNIINELNCTQMEEDIVDKSKMESGQKKKRHKGESDSDKSWRGSSDESDSDTETNKTGTDDSSDDNKSDKSVKGYSVVKSDNLSDASFQDSMLDQENEQSFSHSMSPDISNMLLTHGLVPNSGLMLPTAGNIIAVSEIPFQIPANVQLPIMPENIKPYPVNETQTSANTGNRISLGENMGPTNATPIPPHLLPTLGMRIPGSKLNSTPPLKISLPYLGVNLKTGDLILNPNYEKQENTFNNSLFSGMLANNLAGIGLKLHQLEEPKIQQKIMESFQSPSKSSDVDTKEIPTELQQTSNLHQSEIMPQSTIDSKVKTNVPSANTNVMQHSQELNEKLGEHNLSMNDVYEMISKAQNVEKSETGIQCNMGIEKFCNISIVDEHYYIGRQKVEWIKKENDNIEDDDVEEFEVTKYLLQELTEEEIKEHEEKESLDNEDKETNSDDVETQNKIATEDVISKKGTQKELKKSYPLKSLIEGHGEKENQNNDIDQKENSIDKAKPKSIKDVTDINPNSEVIEIDSDKESDNGKESDKMDQSDSHKDSTHQENNEVCKVTNHATNKKANKNKKNVKAVNKSHNKSLMLSLKNQTRNKLKNRSKKKLEEVIRNINTRNRNRRIMRRRK